MAWRRPLPPDEMPEEVECFRAADWLADVDAANADYDVWLRRKWYDRPRTGNEALRAAYAAFMAARDAWEAEHPEHRRRQVAELVARRIERRRQMEARHPREQ